MDLKQAFGMALKEMRMEKGLTQEDFSIVSSRTYMSMLERGLKSPTLEKIEEICSVLEEHPITLLQKCYAHYGRSPERLSLAPTVCTGTPPAE